MVIIFCVLNGIIKFGTIINCGFYIFAHTSRNIGLIYLSILCILE